MFQKILNCYTLPHHVIKRARIIFEANRNNNISAIARKEKTDRKTVRKWRKRALDFFEIFTWNSESEGEGEGEGSIEQNVRKLLELFQDQQRSGRPNVYTAQQVCEIIKVALEKPEQSDRPISHWTAWELADEVNKRNITDSISSRTVGRILNQVDIKPHRFSYWLNPNIKDQAEFKRKVIEICSIYQQAIKLNQQGINVVSVDEKTGIQALERMTPSKPVKQGSLEKIEFEYQRRGTLCLIPSFKVATGKIIQFRIGETRNEEDFAQHIRKTIEVDPNPHQSWIFIADQLNTHKSVSLVKLVAQLCAIEDDLGKTRKRGILKDMESREKFLTDKSHRIRFVYTPKHCSWLNQVEIWFGILEKKMLKRTSFNSQDKLKERLIDFIAYFNKTMSKPFKWTYSGKALKA